MMLCRCQQADMQSMEIGDIERVEHTSTLRSVQKLLFVGSPDKIFLDWRNNRHTAVPKHFDEVCIHRVFIEVDAELAHVSKSVDARSIVSVRRASDSRSASISPRFT